MSCFFQVFDVFFVFEFEFKARAWENPATLTSHLCKNYIVNHTYTK